MYSVEFKEKAKKQLLKIPKEDQERIILVLERARIRPEKFFERLVGIKLYKLKVGYYRVIADIKNKDLLILVIKIGHRKNIYKKL